MTLNIIIVITIIFKINLIYCVDNNVCPTFRDYYTIKNNSNCWYNFAAALKVPDVIRRSGYPLIEYKMQTKDGYILTMFRIPALNTGKEPVFLLHGVQSTAAIFIGLGRNSLAFLLADAGYDVWLGNYRGNEYSQGHAYLNNTQREYWDYGVDQIALIDLPTMLEVVSNHTGSKGNIIYIGHSLGTATAMMYSSEYPDLAKKTIKAFLWMSPSYTLTHMRSPYKVLLPLLGIGVNLSRSLNIIQLFSNPRRFTKSLCSASVSAMYVCFGALNLFVGPFNQMAPETLPVLFNEFPGGTSLKTMLHLSDSTTGKFRKFDYGAKNILVYGSEKPPEFNISRISVPVMLFYAVNDWATTKEDALNLYKKLPSKVRFGMHEVTAPNFNHLDFVYGRNVKTLVYDRLLQVLDGISSG